MMFCLVDVSELQSQKSNSCKLSCCCTVQSVAGRTGAVTVDAGDLTDGNFDGTAILGFDASIMIKQTIYSTR